MEHIKVIFARSPKPFSLAIRLFTWSHWSHVAVIMPDGKTVIEARGGEGVVETHINEFKRRYVEYKSCRLPVMDRQEAFRELRKELGKPYDMTAIYSMVFRRNWQETDSWFCSELVAHASGLFRQDYVKRITPEDLWRITF